MHEVALVLNLIVLRKLLGDDKICSHHETQEIGEKTSESHTMRLIQAKVPFDASLQWYQVTNIYAANTMGPSHEA